MKAKRFLFLWLFASVCGYNVTAQSKFQLGLGFPTVQYASNGSAIGMNGSTIGQISFSPVLFKCINEHSRLIFQVPFSYRGQRQNADNLLLTTGVPLMGASVALKNRNLFLGIRVGLLRAWEQGKFTFLAGGKAGFDFLVSDYDKYRQFSFDSTGQLAQMLDFESRRYLFPNLVLSGVTGAQFRIARRWVIAAEISYMLNSSFGNGVLIEKTNSYDDPLTNSTTPDEIQVTRSNFSWGSMITLTPAFSPALFILFDLGGGRKKQAGNK